MDRITLYIKEEQKPCIIKCLKKYFLNSENSNIFTIFLDIHHQIYKEKTPLHNFDCNKRIKPEGDLAIETSFCLQNKAFVVGNCSFRLTIANCITPTNQYKQKECIK